MSDEIKLPRHLGARLVAIRAIPVAGTGVRDVPEKRHLGLAGRHRIRGKAITQIGHRVVEPLSQGGSVYDRITAIGKELRHRFRRFQVPLRITREDTAGTVERRVMTHAREHVEQRSIGRFRKADVVGGNHRNAVGLRKRVERCIGGLLVAQQMTLQLDIHVAPPEQADQPVEQAAESMVAGIEQRTPAERNETGCGPVQFLERERTVALSTPPRRSSRPRQGRPRRIRTHLHARDQPAQIPVAFLGFRQNR
jgi:hypothetical protein